MCVFIGFHGFFYRFHAKFQNSFFFLGMVERKFVSKIKPARFKLKNWFQELSFYVCFNRFSWLSNAKIQKKKNSEMVEMQF